MIGLHSVEGNPKYSNSHKPNRTAPQPMANLPGVIRGV